MATRFSNAIAQLRYDAGSRFKQLRRNVRMLIKEPALAREVFAYRRAVRNFEWRKAYERAVRIAPQIEQSRDRLLVHEFGNAFMRFQEFETGFRLLKLHRDITSKPLPKAWNGEELRGKTVLVDTMVTAKQGLGIGINAGSEIGTIAERSARCIVICEKRLLPIFRRSLPNIELRVFGEKPYDDEADFIVDTTDLAYYFSKHKNGLKNFPLKADEALARELREKYLAGRSQKLIGISWNSAHKGKESPQIEAWNELLSDPRYLFVSLQYGEVSADIEDFRKIAGERLIVDVSVDQLKDMDRFAAQLGALDAVATISNTGAHFANMMGIPMILIRDDQFRRNWPVLGKTIEGRPHLIVIGKDGRSWHEVMHEVAAELPNRQRR